MRLFLGLTAVLLLVLACGFFFDAFLVRVTDETAAQVKALSAKDDPAPMMEAWRKRARLLSLAVPQSELEEISDGMLTMSAYLASGDTEEADVQRALVLSALSSLREKYLFSAEGVL